MRQLRLLALVAPALLLVPVVACEDSSSGSSAPFTFEAGPGFEAGPPPEAGPLPADDAGVDAADVFVPPAPKGVTVTVFEGTTAKASVRVLSHDATGAVIGDVKTDATGKVTIAAAPSMITVLATTDSSPTPVTYFGVADGDNLVVRIPGILQEQSPIGSYSITFTPGAQGQSPNANVTVGKGCGSSTGDTTMPLVVSLFPNCVGAANAILADGSTATGSRDGFSFKKSVALPAANATSNVVLPAWAAPGTTTFKATNIPGGSISNTAALYMIANGASFTAGLDPASGQNIGSGTGLTWQTATGFADAYQSIVRTVDDVGAQAESSIIRRETAPATATTTLPDFDFTNALPYITDAAVDTTTVARPVITLTSDKPLTAVDGGIVTISSLNASESYINWTFVVPASAAATFKVPALPTDADAVTFTPAGAGTNTNINRAAFFEATQIPSYKEAKLLPIVPQATLDLLDESVALPINGTVRVTSWQPPAL